MSVLARSLSARGAQSPFIRTAVKSAPSAGKSAPSAAESAPSAAGSALSVADAAPSRGRIGWGRFTLRGLATVVAAVLANTLFYFVGGALVTYDPEFVILANPLGAIIFTLFPAVVAVLLYAGLLRFTRRPAAVFTVISAIVFVLTVIPDFTYIPTVPGSSTAQTAILVLMHVIAAAVIVRLLTATPIRQGR